jgi:hypothetical protein
VVLAILTLSFGAPWITIVALKLIAAETGGRTYFPWNAKQLAEAHAAIAAVFRLPNQMIVLVGRDLDPIGVTDAEPAFRDLGHLVAVQLVRPFPLTADR